MKRDYIYRVKCNHPECKETGFFSFTSRKEYNNFNKQYMKKGWLCVRHKDPDEVLSRKNKKRKVIYINKKNKNGLFWYKEGNQNNLGYGFIYGPNFKAYAYDFEENTKLKITAEIIL